MSIRNESPFSALVEDNLDALGVKFEQTQAAPSEVSRLMRCHVEISSTVQLVDSRADNAAVAG